MKKYVLCSKERREGYHYIVLVITFIGLLILNRYVNIELSQNSYGNPITFLLVSIMGWYFLYEISYFAKRITIIKRSLVYIGQNTKAILILHLLIFKFVNCIGVVVRREPLDMISAFPVLYKDELWWIIYTIVGVSVPLFLSLLWKKLLKIVK